MTFKDIWLFDISLTRNVILSPFATLASSVRCADNKEPSLKPISTCDSFIWLIIPDKTSPGIRFFNIEAAFALLLTLPALELGTFCILDSVLEVLYALLACSVLPDDILESCCTLISILTLPPSYLIRYFLNVLLNKCFSMYRTRTILCKCIPVLLGSISFMLCKAVLRIKLIITVHKPVPCHLCDYTCTGY